MDYSKSEKLDDANARSQDLLALVRPVSDALYALNGKWRLLILISLAFKEKRFGELVNELQGITDRMLARELKELEINLLIAKKAADESPVRVLYGITEHGKSLHGVIMELDSWGRAHRKIITGK